MTVLTTVREQAAETFAKLGWPTPRIEEWRYTNLASVQKIDWRLDGSPVGAPQIPERASMADRAALELVFVNGRRSGSAPAQLPDGVKIAVGSEATIADWERNAMVALNAAHAQDGAHIEIAPNTIVEGFLHLLFIGQGDGIWSHPRNTVVVGANAQVAIVETYVGSGHYFTNAVTEITAGDGAVVDHYRLQCESRDAFHVGNVYIHQERAANVITHSVSLGGSIARVETFVTLAGEGASVVLDGLFAGTGTQHLDNRTVIDHVKPHCESIELYKGVLDQNSRGVFDGRIIVRPNAQKTVSRQENRNLLLSETAVVDSKPTLEIHNDDVKCNHGSTIGQIDQESLFYLRSRGIAEDVARNLLVYAFASQIVDRMKIAAVREQIGRELFRALPERLPERRAGDRKASEG